MQRTISWILILLIVSGMIENGTTSKGVGGGVEDQNDKDEESGIFSFEAGEEEIINDYIYNISESEDGISLMSDLSHLAVFINPDIVGELTESNIQTICLTTLKPFLPSVEVAKPYEPTQFFNENNIRLNYYADIKEDVNFGSIQEFEYYHTGTKLNYLVKRYPKNMLSPFHKEIKLLYKLGSLIPNDKFGSFAYKGCAFVDSYLYVFTANTEYMYSLFSSEMLSKIAELSNSDRKNLFINLARLLLAFHKKNITHGSFTLDNILVNKRLTKFKLKNFQLADDLNNRNTSSSFSSGIAQLSEADSESYYGDVIDLIFVLMYFDEKLHKVDFSSEATNKELLNLEMSNIFSMKYSFPLMNLDRGFKVKEMKKILEKLKIENNAEPEKKAEDSFFSRVFASLCIGCANSYEDKTADRLESKFTPLHDTYLNLLTLDKMSLDANTVKKKIEGIEDTFFTTWVQRESHSDLKKHLSKKAKKSFKINKNEEVIQSTKSIKDTSVNKLIV